MPLWSTVLNAEKYMYAVTGVFGFCGKWFVPTQNFYMNITFTQLKVVVLVQGTQKLFGKPGDCFHRAMHAAQMQIFLHIHGILKFLWSWCVWILCVCYIFNIVIRVIHFPCHF
jgi:hypothetical protein